MKNAYIAFFSSPIAAVVNPVLPLLSALVRRGHRVIYATSEPFVSRAAATGAEVVPYRFGALTAQNVDQTAYCRLAINTLAAFDRFSDGRRPDAVAYDFGAIAGPVLSHRWGVPAIRTTSNFAFSRSYIDAQILVPYMRERALVRNDGADKFLNAHGVQSRDYIFHREKLNLHLFPREFEPSTDALDQSCFHVGRCAGEQAGFGVWRRPASCTVPIILVAPSRSYARGVDYYRLCIEALSKIRCHVILSIDDAHDAAALRPLPDCFEIVQKVSHTKIMPHVNLVVGMAGITTSAEAAYHGLPLIMTSCGAPELEWSADNLMRLGIGVHIRNEEMNAERIRDVVEHVLVDRLILSNVRKLQQSVRRQPGAEEAANEIEEFISSARGSAP